LVEVRITQMGDELSEKGGQDFAVWRDTWIINGESLMDIRTILKKVTIAVATIGLVACGGGGGGGGSTTTTVPTAPSDPSTATYSVGGTVTYLSGSQGSLLLQNNSGDDLTVSNGDQTFTFATKLADGASYRVTAESFTVNGSTTGWVCKVTDGASGVISGADVTSVAVTCGRDVKLNDFGAYVTDQGVVTLLYQAEDSDGSPVSGLTIDDFVVEEDGSAISATESFKDIVPNTDLSYEIKTVLMIDISASIDATELTQVRNAAKGLVVDATGNSLLLPNQQVAVWVFDSNVTRIQDFTNDHTLLQTKIDSITQAGRADPFSTNLYGAAVTGVNQWTDQFSANAVKQGFLVLITDGDDTSGSSTLTNATAARGDKSVYTVAVGTAISQDGQAALLELGNAGYLTAATFDLLATKLQEAAQDLADKVNSFYYLHYATPSRSGTHTVDLSVNNNVYTGPGYSLSGEFTAYSSFGVSAEVVLNDTRLNVAPNDTLAVKARVLWDNASSYDYLWSTIPSAATVTENATDDANAVLSGGASAGTDTLTVSTSDNFTNTISVNVPVQVTEVSLSAPTRILAPSESVVLTASSTSVTPQFYWSATGSCYLSSTSGATVTLYAPSTDTTCTVRVYDASGSSQQYITDFVVGTPGATNITVATNTGGVYYESASAYDFESGVMPSGITMSGHADWVIDTTTGANGTAVSAKAGVITDSQQSRMTITVSGATTVSFWYKVDSEAVYDDFFFYVDGTPVLEKAGNIAWTSYTYTLPDTGVHTLTFEYEKDSVYSSGADTAWVDEIVLQ
jgi:uncharacterized protein YegL